MYRQVILATENKLVLQLPNEMVGKRVEIIAKTIDAPLVLDESKRKEIGNIFNGFRVSLEGYKFNRDEANDYNYNP